MDFNKTDLKENVLIITNEDGSTTCIPEEGATVAEQALFTEFRTEYPDGKPVVEVEPTTPTPIDSERIQALEDAMNALMGV